MSYLTSGVIQAFGSKKLARPVPIPPLAEPNQYTKHC